MTIPAVAAGALIDPAWGNAVADQLNDLPTLIQHGTITGTTDANGRLTVTFPTAFSSAPTVTATAVFNNTSARIVHIVTVSSTQVQLQFSIPSTGAGEGSVSRSLTWIAAGSA